MKIMTGIVLDNANRLAVIEDSYFSRQLQQRIYKVHYYNEHKKVNINQYNFVSENDLRHTKIETKIDWKTCTIKKMLDNTYQASLQFNTQIIYINSDNEVKAFDELYDKIEELIGK